MPKKRRKLSKEHEKSISIALKEIELILAKINDINDDDIRGEYAISFAPAIEPVFVIPPLEIGRAHV